MGWGGRMGLDNVVMKLEAYSRASNTIQEKHINTKDWVKEKDGKNRTGRGEKSTLPTTMVYSSKHERNRPIFSTAEISCVCQG